jgi:DNA-directed RNA polymerase subunit H (RpoH/RPB5)
MEQIYHSYNVYKNLYEFFKRNKYIAPGMMDENAFKSAATNNKFLIDLSRGENHKLTVIMFVGSHPAIRNATDMEKILDSINNNIMIITPEDISSGVQKKINLLADKKNLSIIWHHYMKFTMIFPDRDDASVHRILSKEEAGRLMKNDLMSKAINNNLIWVTGPHADVQAVWIEAKPGDIIHIRNEIETAVYMDNYRLAKHGIDKRL